MSFLGGILDFASHAVGPALNVAAAQQQGQLVAKQRQQQELLQQIALQRQAEQQRLAETLAQSTIQSRQATAKHYENQDTSAQARDATAAKHEQYLESQPKAPVLGTQDYLKAQEDVTRMKAKYRPAPQQPGVFVMGPGGKPIYTPRDQAFGREKPPVGAQVGNLPAPMAAKVGQFGEMLKKADDLLPSMEALDVSLGQSAANDVAQHGVGVMGMHIPGTQGVGSALVNRTPEYSRYQASLSPFILAAAHALSGARINQDQIAQIRQSIEIKPGDSQPVRQQKLKNVVDLINSIGGALPDEAVTAQESQMAPDQIERLSGYGYKARESATQPNDAGGDINLSGPVAKPAKPAKASGFDAESFYKSYTSKKKP